MFYNPMEAQPSRWLLQHSNFEQMDDALFTALLMETQGHFMSSDAGPSFTNQASSLRAPSHEPAVPQSAEGCSHQIGHMTANVIPPTPLKDSSSYSLSNPPHYPSPHERGASIDAGNVNDLFSDPQGSKDTPSSTSGQSFVPGQKSANNNIILKAAFIEIKQLFLELSRSTSIPVQQVINYYFKDHTEQELAHVGHKVPADGGSPVPSWMLGIIADSAAAKFGFETAMVVCGKIINQDASLGQVHTTPGAAEFWSTQCRADDDTIISHLKAHVYNKTSLAVVDDAFNDLPEDDEEASSQDADLIPSTKVKGCDESLWWLKKAITKQVSESHDPMSKNNKGIGVFTFKEVAALVDAFKAGIMQVVKFSNMPTLLIKLTELVIIREAPPSTWEHTSACCMFADQHTDYGGPEHVGTSVTQTRVKKGKNRACDPKDGEAVMSLLPVMSPPPACPFKVVAEPISFKLLIPPPTHPFRVVAKPTVPMASKAAAQEGCDSRGGH
ncbi:hypothetical protein BDR07DRAFT_1381172 [Suillus spraguei]|nr:hypothetical protein BDR07DRAFT_1381172 [Suillus spraguei]